MTTSTNIVPTIISVKVSDVYPNPHNFRKIFDEKDLSELAADIKQNGVTNPPTVRATGDLKKPYMLVQGERRWRAIKLLAWETMAVQLASPDKTTKDLDLVGFVENINRKDLSTYEQAAACAFFVDEHKMSVNEIAKHTGRSTTYVNRLVKPFVELHPAVRKAWQDGHPLCTVETVGKLVSKFEGDAQLEAWSNLVEHGTFSAPEGDTGDGGEGGEGDGETTNEKNKEASSGFRLNPRQVMERYDLIRKSIGGKSATAEEQAMFALVQYLIGKRKAVPEGIEIEEVVKKGPSKPIKTRATRSTASA